MYYLNKNVLRRFFGDNYKSTFLSNPFISFLIPLLLFLLILLHEKSLIIDI